MYSVGLVIGEECIGIYLLLDFLSNTLVKLTVASEVVYGTYTTDNYHSVHTT